ncbi:MAG: hypothetical protein ORN54_01990 [Cyclobacteriaceae bacterium]|nr:hypothetical protein [Cyclobacteriaceae bacterium]
MVKLGFIGEGAVEKIILESAIFQQYLSSLEIDFVKEVVDATGNGNLLPKNIERYTQILKDKGATNIIILTDLDKDQCVTLTKNRIDPSSDYVVVVTIKEVEAWFLADNQAMKDLLSDQDFMIENPEIIENPFQEIRRLRVVKIGRGIPTKVILANQMTSRYGFSVIRAAEHPNCDSAKYLLKSLQKLAGKG